MRTIQYGFWLRSALWLGGALITLLAVAGTVSAQSPYGQTEEPAQEAPAAETANTETPEAAPTGRREAVPPSHGHGGHGGHAGHRNQGDREPLGADGQFSRSGERPPRVVPVSLDLTDAPRVAWSGGVGDWHDGANWEGGRPPGNTEVAVLGPGADVTLDADADLGGFVLESSEEDGAQGATLRLPSASLKIHGGSRVGEGALLVLAGGILTGPGDVSVEGGFRWTGGSISGNGDLHIAETGNLELSGADRKVLSLRSLDNAGHLTWTGDGSWVVTFNSRITNLPSGRFVIESPTLLDVYGPPGPTLENRGELVRAGAGTTTFETPFTNAGSVSVEGGTLALLDAFVQTGGTTRVAAGAAIESPREMEVLGGTVVGEGNLPATLKAVKAN